jgi:hypothetical protein
MEMVRTLPIGMDATQMCDYIELMLKKGNRHENVFTFFDRPVSMMDRGNGVMFTLHKDGDKFRLTMPGTKSKAGLLIQDGSIFQITGKSEGDTLGISLSGSRVFMEANIALGILPEVLKRMQCNGHIEKFYLPDPDPVIISALKTVQKKPGKIKPPIEDIVYAASL